MTNMLNSNLTKWFIVAAALLFLAACTPGGTTPAQATLDVVVNGNGTVTSDDGNIACGTDCQHTYDADDEAVVTLTAAAATNTEGAPTSNFVDWEGCPAATGNTCTVTMTDDATVTANFEDVTLSDETTVTSSVAAEADDVEELVAGSTSDPTNFPAGHTFAESSDLDLAFDPVHETVQVIGLLFRDLAIPENAVITNATLTFVAGGEGNAEDVTLEIYGEANTAPADFADDPNESGSADLTSRTGTTATVDWDVSGEWTAGSEQTSADLASVIQEIVSQEGWASGNNIAIFITSESEAGYRTVQSTGADRTAPVLSVTYRVPVEDGGDGGDEVL